MDVRFGRIAVTIRATVELLLHCENKTGTNISMHTVMETAFVTAQSVEPETTRQQVMKTQVSLQMTYYLQGHWLPLTQAQQTHDWQQIQTNCSYTNNEAVPFCHHTTDVTWFLLVHCLCCLFPLHNIYHKHLQTNYSQGRQYGTHLSSKLLFVSVIVAITLWTEVSFKKHY